ncbi:MAG: ferritin family protein [Anaerolineae bacterium]|jgi:rubrerythrin|nr:ferritin family protein [Anaerolineae bacterium]MDH7473982.1 ferritin family protein [Anaerolineae bacterium]
MPEKEITIEEIVRQAIKAEEEARSFYEAASKMVSASHVQDTLKELAGEEVKHKQKLEALLQGDVERMISRPKPHQIQDLKLAEYLKPQTLDENASFQDVLIVAMQREKASYDFYTLMASIAASEEPKKLFEFLAQEELGHKNKVETLYDEIVYKEF